MNRWVDAGYLELSSGITRNYEIRLTATKRKLTNDMLRTIVEESERWAEHKRECMRQMMRVLGARSPQQRQRYVLRYFGETDWRRFEHQAAVVSELPKWLSEP